MASDVSRRIVAFSLAALVINSVLLIAIIVCESHGVSLHIGTDFASFWAAARLALAGVADKAYDLSVHAAAETIRPNMHYYAFFYPPTFLLLCVPFGLLPFYSAMFTFMTASGVVYVWASTRVARWAWITAFAFPPMIFNLVSGQNSMLTAAIMGAGLTMMDRKPRSAGMLLGFMVIKPQLAVVLPIALLVSRRWRVLTYAGLSGLGIVLASGTILGWDAWVSFLLTGTQTAKHVLEDGDGVITGVASYTKVQSVFGLVRMNGASLYASYVAQIITAVTAISALIWSQLKGTSAAVERSLIVVVTLLVTPYAMYYDSLVLIFPCLWFMTEWIATKHVPVAGVLVVLTTFLSPVAHIGLIPLVGFTYSGNYLADKIVLLVYLGILTASHQKAHKMVSSCGFTTEPSARSA
jgi:hypothetical protein